MANAYSSTSNFGAPINTTDVANLITTTQRAMEKSYDANLAKVDSLIESYTSIPLVRSSDKQYLGERLQTLLSAVDKNSKINWTSGTAAREVNNYISAAVDDNVLKQMANSQKIINFEQTAAERKAKNPELYNDANYIYAKDKGGYEAYMKGESNDVGSLQYIDYYDVKKNLTDEVEKYAKEKGFEKVVSQDNNQYIYRTVKGKEVKPEEIENFVKSAISSDSRLQQQLLIDSHAQYRGLKDEQVLEGYSKYINEEVKVYDTRIENLDNEKKNTNKDDLVKITELERQKTALNEEKNSLLSKTKPENFNRDSVQLEHYTKGLINNYTKTYAFSDITDIDYDDVGLKIAKAEGKLTEEGVPTTGAIGTQIGQQFDVAVEAVPEGEQVSNFTKIEEEADQAWKELVPVIKKSLVADGKPTTRKNIADYYAGLRKASKEGFNINAGGYTDEEIEAFNKVVQNNIVLDKATKIAKTQYGGATTEVLEGLFGGSKKGLNTEGLAQTMPYTVGLLNKYNSADQMTKKERALALIEVANNAKNTLSEDENDKKYYDLYINSIKRDNKITERDLKPVRREVEEGFWSGAGQAVWGEARKAGNLARMVGQAFINPFYREDAARQNREEVRQDLQRAVVDTEAGIRTAARGIENIFTTDRNLSEVQSGDINLKNYRAPKSVFSAATAAAKEQIERESEKYRANIPKGKSLILNPDIKAEKPYVAQFANAIIAAGHTPAEGTYINLVNVKDGLATVKYQEVTDSPTATEGVTKKYTVDSTVQIPISNLPPAILSRLDIVQRDFGNSIKNPTRIVRPLTYSPPLDMDSKRILEEDYLRTSGNSMSQEELNFIRLNGIPDIKTKEEYIKEASILPPAYFERFKQELQSDYKVSWERPEGGGAFIGRLMKNGKEVEKTALAEDYSPYRYKNYTAKTVSNYIEKRLQELRTEYQRTRQ